MILHRKPIRAAAPLPSSSGRWRWLALATLLLTGSSLASDRTRQALERCEAAAEGIAACLLREANDLDYVVFLRMMHLKEFACAPLTTSLDQAHGHWQDYRKTHCDLYRESADEDAAALDAALCELRLTVAREQELDLLDRAGPRSRELCGQ